MSVYDPKYAYNDDTKFQYYMNGNLSKCESEIFKRFLKPGDTVLDVGCFVGRVSFQISNLVAKVVGIDVSNKAIEFANKERLSRGISNVVFEEDVAANIPYEDGYFDKILFPYFTLEDISPRKDRVDSLKEMERVLQKEGLLILSIHNRFYYRWYRALVMHEIVRLLSGLFPKTTTYFLTRMKGQAVAKIMRGSEHYTIIWKEPGSARYISAFFYSLTSIKLELDECKFKIHSLIPIEDHNPYTQAGINGNLIKGRLPSFLIPSYYVVAKKARS